VEGVSQPPSDDVIRELSRSLRQSLGVSLFGIDVIINNQTGQHAVIDINAFPGKRGFLPGSGPYLVPGSLALGAVIARLPAASLLSSKQIKVSTFYTYTALKTARRTK